MNEAPPPSQPSKWKKRGIVVGCLALTLAGSAWFFQQKPSSSGIKRRPAAVPAQQQPPPRANTSREPELIS
jgi:hypothetical protein